MPMVTCLIDGKEFKNGGVLARHLKKVYGLTYKEYYHKHVIKTDTVPTCKCGCGTAMVWKNMTGYAEFVKGHYSRVHNNWGHNKTAIEKSSATRRAQFAAGERTVWNAGLSKETDDRVAANGAARASSITPEDRKMYSDQMRKNRLNGTVPTLSGADHPQWKGGVSTINQLARADRRLYTDWKYPILERDGFKCTKCGNTHDLHVHHDKETFSEIMMKVITNEDLLLIEDNDKKREFVERITNYHVKNLVPGVTLCHDCHAEFHPSLNFR